MIDPNAPELEPFVPPVVSPDEQISLDAAPVDEGVSLEDTTKPAVSEKTADIRSDKANYGWPAGKSPGKEVIRNAMRTGGENEIRERAVSDSNAEYRKNKIDLVKGVTTVFDNTPDTSAFLEGLVKAQPVYTRDTVFETKYANAYVNNVILKGQAGAVFQKGMDEYFNHTMDTSHIAEATVARKEIFQTIAEDADALVEKQGMGGYLVDMAKGLVPGYSWAKMHNQVAVASSLLPGSNLEEQIQHLWLLPVEEARVKLKDAVTRLAQDNPQEAQRLAHAAVAYGTGEALLSNLFGVADAVGVGQTVGAVGKAVVRKLAGKTVADVKSETVAHGAGKTTITGTEEVRKAFKDSVRAMEGHPKPEEVLAANGHVNQAAELKAGKVMKAGDPNGDGIELTSRVPSLFNVETIIQNPGTLSREQTDMLVSSAQERSTRLIKTLEDPSKVNRAPDEAYAVGVREAREELSRRYPHLNDAILDVETRDGELLPFKYNRPEDNHANVASVSIHVGTPEAGLFGSGQEAVTWAEKMYKLDLTDPGLRIQQQGSGFYLSITKNVDETTDAFRNALITTKNTTPQSLANTWVGWLRNPEDTLSAFNRENRHSLTHAGELIKSQFVEAARDLNRKLSSKQLDRMERLFEVNRSFRDPVTGAQGRFYTTTGEFEDAYHTMFKTRPTIHEHNAYWTYVQLNDMDWVVRNLGWYRDKARMGVENVSFSHMVKNDDGVLSLTKTRPFEGRYVSEIPWKQADDAGIYVVDAEGRGSLVRKNYMSTEARADIDQKLAEGYRVVQFYTPAGKNVGIEGGTAHFAIVKDSATTKLGWQQAPYRPGGHVEYADKWFTKQPKITRTVDADGTVRHVNEGDVAAFSHSTEAEAKEFSTAMETARLLMNRNMDKELEAHLAQSLPYSKKQFKNLFSEYIENGKVIPAVYSKDHGFAHTASGQTTAERAALGRNSYHSRYENYEDTASSPYNMSASVDKKFAGTRDSVLDTVEKRGSETNPVFQLKASPLLDPMTTLNRSMANIMRSRLMSDYKLSSVESFIQEFGHLINVDKDTLRANPVFHLHNPAWQETSDVAQLAAAKNMRMNVLNLLGTESDVGKAIRAGQNTLMDAIYNKTGQEGLAVTNKIVEHTPDWLISTISDPAKALRSMAFHLTQGMFNPIQLALQAQTLTHVMAVAGPKNGMSGLVAGTLMRYAGLTEQPAVIARLAMIAEKMGAMKGKDFIESYHHFRKSGLHHVEGEVANLDNVVDPKMFQSAGAAFLDKGVFFFQQGEKMVRYAAWNAAYKEWRTANPLAELTNGARNEILTRSNLFGANMTRASSAAWQQGVYSVPSQFFGYPVRLAEQFLGKRLTWAEKGQALATYGAMYGVPSAAATATMIPFYEDMKTYALDHGYDIHSNWFKGFMEGIPSMTVSAMGGHDTNFASRYGSNGVSIIHDIAHGNMSLAQAVTGASGSIFGGMLTAVSPLLKQVSNVFKPGNEQFPLKMEDFQEAAVASSLTNTMKAAIGLTSHKYLSKNGVYVTDISASESALLFFGLQPRRVTDANLKARSMMETKKDQKGWENLVVKETNRALEEGYKGNIEAMNDYLKRAKVYYQSGDFQATQSGQILTKSLKGWEAKIDQIEMNFRKNAPASQLKARTDAMYPEMNK